MTLLFRMWCWNARCFADREHEGTRRGTHPWPVKSRCLHCGYERLLLLLWSDVEKWHAEYVPVSA